MSINLPKEITVSRCNFENRVSFKKRGLLIATAGLVLIMLQATTNVLLANYRDIYKYDSQVMFQKYEFNRDQYSKASENWSSSVMSFIIDYINRKNL